MRLQTGRSIRGATRKNPANALIIPMAKSKTKKGQSNARVILFYFVQASIMYSYLAIRTVSGEGSGRRPSKINASTIATVMRYTSKRSARMARNSFGFGGYCVGEGK